jgi:hypothetical protein
MPPTVTIVSRSRVHKRAGLLRDAGRRLADALEALKGKGVRVTAAELCRVAAVSRNSLYRYHAPILKSLHDFQRRGPASAQRKARKSAERQRSENRALQEKISKLAALVDHYYGAYREAAGLLARRDRELAEVRRQLGTKPLLLPARR